MVTIMIVTDDGKAYCMSADIEAATDCINTLHNDAGKIVVKYIGDKERRLKYLSHALDVIDGRAEQ